MKPYTVLGNTFVTCTNHFIASFANVYFSCIRQDHFDEHIFLVIIIYRCQRKLGIITFFLTYLLNCLKFYFLYNNEEVFCQPDVTLQWYCDYACGESRTNFHVAVFYIVLLNILRFTDKFAYYISDETKYFH